MEFTNDIFMTINTLNKYKSIKTDYIVIIAAINGRNTRISQLINSKFVDFQRCNKHSNQI